ncbi:hypothetical protein [Microbacterium gorillae]|uniref:hypothetical protein n=1 Tax=Microbacterium gorillae TaxID=1231063 RepID=UPI003D9728E9
MNTARSTSGRHRRTPLRLLLVAVSLLAGLLVLAGASATPAIAQTAAAGTTTPAAIQAPVTSPSSFTYAAAPSPLLLAQAQHAPTRIDFDTPPNKEDAEKSIYDSQYRSINRWGDATTSFFTKYDGFVGTQLIDQAQRGLNQSLAMSVGNFFSNATSNFTQWAVSFSAIDTLGASIDDITGQIVRALFTMDGSGGAVGSALITGLMLVLVLIIMWQSARNGGAVVMARRLTALVLVFAMLFAMANAALSGGGTTDEKGYHPVILSPGWVVKSVNDTVGSIANVPASLFVDGIQTIGATENEKAGNNLSCANFQVAMNTRLTEQQESATNAGSGGLVAITTVMDQLSESTGLETWKKIQTGFNNPFGENVYCRILEERSTASTPFWSAYLTGGGAGTGWMQPVFSTHVGENAPFAPNTPNNTAATYVAWAACTPTEVVDAQIRWKWTDGWVGFQGGVNGIGGAPEATMDAGNADENCKAWWNAVSVDGAEQNIPNIFDISGEAGWIDDRTKNIEGAGRDQVRDFLYALTGVNATGGATATGAYAVSSFMQFLAFGSLDVVTVIAKLFNSMFTFAIWFVLLGALFSRNPFKERIVKSFNKFLGVTVFASMMTAIMTFIVIFSRILIGLGNGMFGPGSLFGMLWAGFAPITALILVHLMFTKVFRMPSPVTVSGVRAWSKASASGTLGAAAAGGVGAGVGAALTNRARTLGNKAGDAAKAQSKRAGSAALYKATGGRFGQTLAQTRRSAMNAGSSTRARDAEADAATDKLKPFEIKRKAAETRKKELAEARAWHQETTGEAAPGDLRNNLRELGGHVRDRAVERTRELAKQTQDKIASSPIARELRSREDYRHRVRQARKLQANAVTDEDREKAARVTQAVHEIRQSQAKRATSAVRRIAAVVDAPAAVAARARLGVEARTERVREGVTRRADEVWNSPTVISARLNGALAADNLRSTAKTVADSRVAKVTAVVARHGVKSVRVAAKGAEVLATRSAKNAAVIEQYRAAMAVQREKDAKAIGAATEGAKVQPSRRRPSPPPTRSIT